MRTLISILVAVAGMNYSFAAGKTTLDFSDELKSAAQELESSEKSVQKKMQENGVVLDTRITRPATRDPAMERQNRIQDKAGEISVTTEKLKLSSQAEVEDSVPAAGSILTETEKGT